MNILLQNQNNIKKFILLLLIVFPFLVYSQSYNDPKEYLFSVNIEDTYKSGSLYLKIDNNGKYYLGLQEYSTYQNFLIYKGNPLYIKLGNNNIITLTCNTKTIVWRGSFDNYANKYYEITTVFYLDNKTLELLRNNKIIKLRGLIKEDIKNIVISKYSTSIYNFIEKENKLQVEYKNLKQQEFNQQNLNKDPLLGF